MNHIKVQGQDYPVIHRNFYKSQSSSVYLFEIPHGDVSLIIDGSNLKGTISRYGEMDSLSFEDAQELLTSIKENEGKNMVSNSSELQSMLYDAVKEKNGFEFWLKDENLPSWISKYSESEITSTTVYAQFVRNLENFIREESSNILMESSHDLDTKKLALSDFNAKNAILRYLECYPETFIDEDDITELAKELISSSPEKFVMPIANLINKNFYGIISTEDGDIIEPYNLQQYVLSTILKNDTIDVEELVGGKLSETTTADLILQDLMLYDNYDEYTAQYGEDLKDSKKLKHDLQYYLNILRTYLSESLENYLRSEHLPEILCRNTFDTLHIINSVETNLIEEIDILKYYVDVENSISFNEWLNQNMPHQNLVNKNWAKSLDSIVSDYHMDLIDNIRDEYPDIDFQTVSIAVKTHPLEDLLLYDKKLSVEDFVGMYIKNI